MWYKNHFDLVCKYFPSIRAKKQWFKIDWVAPNGCILRALLLFVGVVKSGRQPVTCNIDVANIMLVTDPRDVICWWQL